MIDFYKQQVINDGMDINDVPITWRVGVFLDPEIQSIYKPTEEDTKKMLKLAKELKILESKASLAEYLEAHPLISDCHNGIEAEYSVTSEKQALLTSNYLIYNIAKQANIEVPLTWNATGQECEVWTEEEFNTLLLQVSSYVKPLVSLQQKYEVQIKNCESFDELNTYAQFNYDGLTDDSTGEEE